MLDGLVAGADPLAEIPCLEPAHDCCRSDRLHAVVLVLLRIAGSKVLGDNRTELHIIVVILLRRNTVHCRRNLAQHGAAGVHVGTGNAVNRAGNFRRVRIGHHGHVFPDSVIGVDIIADLCIGLACLVAVLAEHAVLVLVVGKEELPELLRPVAFVSVLALPVSLAGTGTVPGARQVGSHILADSGIIPGHLVGRELIDRSHDLLEMGENSLLVVIRDSCRIDSNAVLLGSFLDEAVDVAFAIEVRLHFLRTVVPAILGIRAETTILGRVIGGKIRPHAVGQRRRLLLLLLLLRGRLRALAGDKVPDGLLELHVQVPLRGIAADDADDGRLQGGILVLLHELVNACRKDGCHQLARTDKHLAVLDFKGLRVRRRAFLVLVVRMDGNSADIDRHVELAGPAFRGQVAPAVIGIYEVGEPVAHRLGHRPGVRGRICRGSRVGLHEDRPFPRFKQDAVHFEQRTAHVIIITVIGTHHKSFLIRFSKMVSARFRGRTSCRAGHTGQVP